MRIALLVALAMLAGFDAEAADPLPSFADSPYREPIPDHGSCDVIVNESNYTVTLAETSVDSPAKRVFCVEPGDYRALGQVLMMTSGTEQARRFLRFHADDGVENAVQRSERAIFESIKVVGDWWVVQGLTIEPLNPATTWFLTLYGSDHTVVDGNLIDGGRLVNTRSHDGIVVSGLFGDSAADNVVQRNLVRNGNRSRLDVDFTGITVAWALEPGEDNDHNRVIDNEVADWGDGVAMGGVTTDCSEPGVQHGTVIDGNDIYLTGAKRVDCDSGAPDPDGGCACGENGVDVKGDPGPEPENWTRVMRNRVWGYRPTSDNALCGGSGANGQAITAGNFCTGHVLVARNVVMDSTNGIQPGGGDWIIAGNVVYETRKETPSVNSTAIRALATMERLDMQFNTIVAVDGAYDDAAPVADTRCNVVIEDAGLLGQGQPRGLNHSTSFNYLYHAPAINFVGASNQQFATAGESGDADLCFWRKRWSGPEHVCIPLAATTAASPHLEAVPQCDPDLAAPLGLPTVGFMTAPEPGVVLTAAAALAALTALAWRRPLPALTRCRRCGASCRCAARAAARRAARS